jgi:hypothetical protein
MVLLLGAGGFLVLLLLVVAGAWIGSQRRLSAEWDQLRQRGEPASVAEIEAYYKVPRGKRDTTHLWLTAFAPLDTPQFQADGKDLPFIGPGDDSVPLPGESWPQLSAAEQFLSKYRRSLDAMHQAAREGGHARFPTRFADGISMLLPHAQQIRAGARLLALETVVSAHRRQPDAVMESVTTMFAAARSLEQEPILVCQLVRMALSGMARARIAWLLSADILDDEQLQALDAELATSDYHQPLRRALMGERVIGLQAFANPRSLGPDFPNAPLGLTPSSDQTMYLQIMSQMISAADSAGPARKQAIDRIDTRLKQLAGNNGAKLRYPITLLMVPALSAFGEAGSRNEAERDATRTALAIERFRHREGRLPAKIDQLVPNYLGAPLIDPFDGAALRYRADAAEYLVYSVGSNGVDDGGVTQPPAPPADIVVRVRISQTGSDSAETRP